MKIIAWFLWVFSPIFIALLINIANAKPLNKHLLSQYNLFRKVSGCDFIVSSGYRSKAHNKAVGGVRNSMHLKGLALDLVPFKSCSKNYRELSVVASKFFSCVIRYKTHIHVDIGKRAYYSF